MKKLVRSLFILTLCSTALSGCDFFSVSEAEKEADGLELRNFKTAVVKNSIYEFTGQAFLKYSDNTEKEVTDECTYPTLDTSKLGTFEYKVSYEGTKFIYSKTTYIKVVDKIKLESLEISDYTEKLYASEEAYTFDGKVIAKYTDSTEKDVTKSAVVSAVDISKSGTKELVVSYTESGVTKSVTKQIEVLKELKSISVSGYTSTYVKDTTFKFDGKVVAKYSDNSTEDVTSKVTLDSSAIDTKTIGKYPLKISYTEDGKTLDTTVEISVSEAIPKLQKITAEGYTTTVEKGKTYQFDGKVTATFDNGSEADVTADCTFSTISTTSTGNKNLTITYNDVNSSTSKYTTIIIEVIAKVSAISAPTSMKVAIGKTKSLSASVTPTDAKNKNLTYESNNTSVATVNESGEVTGIAAGTATITITSEDVPTVKATTTINVAESFNDAWTILLYLCGADLESDNSFATSDLNEIKSVAGQPEDVNFVIQTGGAKTWHTSGISNSYNQRFHIKNKALVSDNSQVYSTYKSMGESQTLQDFLEWGISTYPAEKYGLIFWNHGGAMQGVCYDEKKNDDNLLTDEVITGVKNALKNQGMEGEKLEFVGYDACLMQVQDIASMNADYFNYMIASEESEAGEGWDYDTWLDDLYAAKSTETVLKAVVDGFIADNGGTNSSQNDQTLSYLDLSKMPAYINAWNALAVQLNSKVTSSNKSQFNTLVKSAKHYAESYYTYYGTFDAKDFINKLAANSTFKPDASYTNAVLDAFDDLVAYSSKGKGAGNSYGLCMFWSCSSNCEKSVYYTASMTKLTDWRTLVINKGQ